MGGEASDWLMRVVCFDASLSIFRSLIQNNVCQSPPDEEWGTHLRLKAGSCPNCGFLPPNAARSWARRWLGLTLLRAEGCGLWADDFHAWVPKFLDAHLDE
jgi:hypothetical protein